MRGIFDSFNSTSNSMPTGKKSSAVVGETSTGAKIVKRERTKKASDSEIREKLEIHREKNAPLKKNPPPQSVSKEGAVGDVALNNPRDPMTSEKLKSLITSGGFNFSEKERKALSEILGK